MCSVSIIIGTRNRAESLSKCLEYISKISSTVDWELIISDNDSTDNTKEIAENFFKAFPNIKSIYTKCSSKGVANAHNQAAKLAHGDVISFVDDDCYVYPSHIDDVSKLFAENDLAYAGGRIVLFDKTDANLTTNYTDHTVHLRHNRWVLPFFVQGANLMVRRHLFLSIGGFDPQFGAGGKYSGADADLANRLSRKGYFGTFAPRPEVQHHHGRKPGTTEKLEKFYAYGFGAIMGKNITLSIYGSSCTLALLRLMRFFVKEKKPGLIFDTIKGLSHYITKERFVWSSKQ